MQTFRIPFTNFQFGEISPSLIGRTDTQVYTNSAQKLTNFLLRAEGGVIKRNKGGFLGVGKALRGQGAVMRKKGGKIAY